MEGVSYFRYTQYLTLSGGPEDGGIVDRTMSDAGNSRICPSVARIPGKGGTQCSCGMSFFAVIEALTMNVAGLSQSISSMHPAPQSITQSGQSFIVSACAVKPTFSPVISNTTCCGPDLADAAKTHCCNVRFSNASTNTVSTACAQRFLRECKMLIRLISLSGSVSVLSM